FNEIGWLSSVSDAYSNQSSFSYDVVANLIQETSPSGNTHSYKYDGFHHRTQTTDPLGKVTQVLYKDTGDVYRVSDPRSRLTYYSYNGFGEVTQVRSPDTGTTDITYDEAGNVATRKTAKGQTTSYSYDALNRIIEASSGVAGESPILYGYDEATSPYGMGRLTSVDDGNGVRRYGYTPEGWLAYETWETHGQSLTTQYQYDGAGLITKITYPSGREVSYTRDLAGDVIEVATTQAGTTTSLASQIERAPFGPVTSMVRWNGISESRSLDLNYRVTGIDATRVHSLVYRYTPDSLISAIDDNLSSSVNQSLGYDAVGRITSAEGLYGVLGYGYDATGNRTSITTDGLSQSYTINYMNNWLVKTGQTSRSYDANGNLTKQGADTFTYDSQNRLVAATVAGVTAAYTYNHLDQRVTKTLNGQTRLLIYGLAGNLIEELDAATGDVLAEYIWLDGTPLSFAQSGQTYQVHVDHLGTPKALTDASGQVVWKASYSPFGKASITTQGPTFNLRFPGQYYDAETGLHYNWRRYYDPNTGRYITSDPIGLAGGINTYAYALSNPIGNADPTGEFVPLLLGAYVAIDFALSAWDAYDTFKTITSDCATSREKWISGGLFAAGIILPGNYKALGNVAERAFKNTADDFVDLASSQRRKHILDGDATGGGHRAGTGKPGKSEFPQSWSDEKIMHVISDIATDPNVSRKAGRGGRTIAEAVKEGINVRVIQESNGDIVSGFPTNVPRNPK
ncbi:EndoU domain-containing protein, partial [Citrobacter freundii]|nr:EndoU domain-containing protein [Citrobacter freundii]